MRRSLGGEVLEAEEESPAAAYTAAAAAAAAAAGEYRIIHERKEHGIVRSHALVAFRQNCHDVHRFREAIGCCRRGLK